MKTLRLALTVTLTLALLLAACATPTPNAGATAAPGDSPATVDGTVALPTATAPALPTANVTPTLEGAVPGQLYAYSSASPDGRWSVETVVSVGEPGYHHVRFVARAVDGAAEWLIVDEERPEGLGFPSPMVLHWLPEAPALYYTESATPDGCALAPFHTGLYRVALDDGSVSTLSDELLGYLAISSAGDRVVYQPSYLDDATLPAEWDLAVRDLESGEEVGFSLGLSEGTNIVNYVWSPEGTHLLIVTDAGECFNPIRSILLLDLASGAVTTILERSTSHPLYAQAWPEPGRALLSTTVDDAVWLDVESGTLEGLPEGFLPEQDAIARAIAYCDQGFSADAPPRVVQAELVVPGSAQNAEWLGARLHAPDLALWRVELAGQWINQSRPPLSDAPPQAARCAVLLNARNGALLTIEETR